jgi:L-ascorbate metabolism protein UlaG (beta-lactamase superfamily)
LKNLIIPRQKDEQLLNDIHSFNQHDGFKVWWLAQSGFLVKWNGKIILLDPYLSESLSIKYQQTENPHVRMSELVIDPARLDFIDIVTSSHNHTDHLDADTLIPIIKNNPGIKFIIANANRDFVVKRLGGDYDFPIGLNEGLSVEYAGFKITGLPSAHNEVERNDQGECRYMGFIVEFGGYTFYHSGDTILFEGLQEMLQQYKIDIAFLPINGNKPERKVAGNLNPRDAALLGKAIGAKLVIPHPEAFKEQCIKCQVNYKVMEMGEGFVYH